QTYVDGQPGDTFRRINDSEGRTLTNQIKSFPGLALSTVITYDGDTERVLKTEVLQNGASRSTRVPLPEVRQGDGTYQLPVRVTPAWGIPSVETYPIGDPLARRASLVFDNGDAIQVIEWFDGTALPKISERRDRIGQPKER